MEIRKRWGMVGLVILLLGGWVVAAQPVSTTQPTSQPAVIDDDESRARLLRKLQGEEEGDVMTQLMRRMAEVTQRLDQQFDPGLTTQELQEKIISDLDLAIQQARKNLRRQKNSPQQSDSRTEGQTDQSNDQSTDQPGSSDSATQTGAAPGESLEPGSSGELRERRRQWGNLPERDREELLQGFTDDVQERFREQIRRYYEALSRPPEE
ncbi:MAG: hypothetical protein HJJLKODD_01775 [Phycisphaerae bacterium]|nr:hypothetical protein [Phycisphaerae bacterium]